MSQLTCRHSDQDLLMVVHGAAGTIKWLDVQVRLLSCPACRERMADHKRLSSSLAYSLRNPSSMAPAGSPNPWRFRTMGGGAFFALLIGVLLIAGVATTVSAFSPKDPPAPVTSPVVTPPIAKCATTGLTPAIAPTLPKKRSTK